MRRQSRLSFVFRGIPFRYVHDIAALITSLEQSGVPVPSEIRSATALTEYAVTARYPSPAEPVTEDEYREAVTIASITVRWIERQMAAES
ncbi:MAG TPA: HEPN domain-containing protein [Chloroflexota bacterium]|nr:HEPN domain-containing protein [Chloroflexota bacterium]